MPTTNRRFGTAACRAVAAAFMLLLTTTPAAAQPDLQRSLTSCVSQTRELSADTVVQLQEQCPGLLDALTAAGYTDVLVPPLVDETTAGRLWDIHDFFIAPESSLSPRLRADHAAIDRILSEFRESTPAPEPSWSERFLAWLDEMLGDRADPDLAWLENLVETLIEYRDAFTMFAYATLLLLAAMAVWLLAKLIPFKRWRVDLLDRQSPQPRRRSATQPLSLAAIRAMPAASQAPALLAYVLHELVGSGRLPADRSLTNHEFARLLARSEQPAGRLFDQLCRFVERQLYGDRLLTSEELSTCFDTASTLTAGTARRATADA